MLLEGIKIWGEVVEGRQLGRQLGFPTANVMLPIDLMIEDGVYRSRVTLLSGLTYDAVTNIGSNPTVGGSQRRAESYILGFDDDIYGATIEIELVEKIRDEITFASVEELREQIESDINTIQRK